MWDEGRRHFTPYLVDTPYLAEHNLDFLELKYAKPRYRTYPNMRKRWNGDFFLDFSKVRNFFFFYKNPFFEKKIINDIFY